AGNPSPCAAATDHNCKCPQWHSCADKPCQFCLALPACGPGSEPSRIGAVNFKFGCKLCENGTYSSSRNSWCRPWTNCESIGFLTLQEGNSSHNAVC
ncbi:TNR18 factor, partial [Picathartes gymnocephalus]|nr:TNR18 factor [Picathartes gymnocephalus]